MALLEGKIAVVTGAGRGIGRATALAFANEGARVVVNDTGGGTDGTGSDPSVAADVVRQIHDAGGEAIASGESIATRAGASALIEQAQKACGRIDVLVNSAGIALDGRLSRVTEADFERLLQVHLAGTLWCTQAAAAHMTRQGAGSIVMSTSSAGLLGNFGQSASAAADAAVYGLMRTACVELQRQGVRVNAVAALAKTRLTEKLPLFEQVDSMTPEHVAPANVFLASELAKDITGVVLAVAGGRISLYRMVESAAAFKETAGGRWTPSEIAEHFATIRR